MIHRHQIDTALPRRTQVSAHKVFASVP
jgi:hypothetical protein